LPAKQGEGLCPPPVIPYMIFKCQMPEEIKMNTNSLTGTYTLISWENRHDSGDVTYPLGPEAKGVISYSDDGFVFVHIMANNRKKHSAGALFGGEPAEIVNSATTHVSYCGTYTVEGNEVIHYLTIASFPNWVSSEQRRTYEFKDGNLLLSFQLMQVGGEKVGAYLIWQPVSNQQGIS